ncbi:MAG: response regulator [Elusimicrobia bacterium]|nr:response regulator [Elusimicrobiota bacterium]
MGWFSGKPKILVADDEANIRSLVQETLAGIGYEVHAVPTGAELLRCVEDVAPALIILDVMMPGMDGWTALERLRAGEKTREIPVLMLTALQRGKDVEESFSRGAKDFLAKPFTMAHLLKKVEKLAPRK